MIQQISQTVLQHAHLITAEVHIQEPLLTGIGEAIDLRKILINGLLQMLLDDSALHGILIQVRPQPGVARLLLQITDDLRFVCHLHNFLQLLGIISWLSMARIFVLRPL